jgi:hypothetical protein
MSAILKKRVPATRRNTNLGLSSRTRWRERFARGLLMRPKNFFLFIPFTVSMMIMAPVVWADNDKSKIIYRHSSGAIQIEQDIESPLPPSPADAEKALGDVFASREGGRTVGAGQVTEIIESPLPPSEPDKEAVTVDSPLPPLPIVEPGEVIPDYVMLPGFGKLEELGAEVEVKSAYHGVAGGFAVGRLNAASPGPSPDDSSKFSITHLTQINSISNSDGLAIEPGAIDFGNVAIGEATTQTFTLSNSGDNSRSITAIEPLMGLFMDDEHGNVTTLVRSSSFQSDNTVTCQTNHLSPSSPSSDCRFSVNFEPQASGTEAALLYISNQDEFGNPGTPLTVPLQGTGIEATFGLNIVVEPMSHDFGEVKVGFSDYQMFKVSNRGTVPFRIEKITLPEISMSAMGSGFSIANDSCSEQTLNPRQSCFVVVKFMPTALGEKTATLYVYYGPKTPIYVKLKGTGVGYCPNPPKVQIRPDPIDFGQVSLGSSSSMPVSVYMKAQNCDLPLNIDDITVTGSNAGEFPVLKPLWCKNGIRRNTSYSYCRLLLGFRPMEPAGMKEAELNVIFNDTSTKTIPIKAEAIPEPPRPEITLKPTAYDFGNVVIGSSSEPAKFTVKNTGNVPVQIRSRFEEGNVDNFSIEEDNCRRLRSLSPGRTCTMSVTFNPLEPAGQKRTELHIIFRTLISPLIVDRVTVPLTGMALKPIPCSDASITIETRQSGRWSDPRTWTRIRTPIPNANDVVRINPEHTVKAYLPYPKKVKSLCIKPRAELFFSNHHCSPDRLPSWTGIRATDLIQNEGTIRGQNGRYEPPCAIANVNEEEEFQARPSYPSWWWPYPGASIYLIGENMSNSGLIIAGHGASGERPTNGGDIVINTRSSFSNTGTLIAGHGGDSSGRYAGRGGYITVYSGNILLRRLSTTWTGWTGRRICGSDYDMSGTFVGASGDICAGNGGHLTSPTQRAKAGHGGRIFMKAINSLSAYRTRFDAGSGGNCYGPYMNQRGGDASGDIILLARYKQLVNPWLTAGRGGINCEPGGRNGRDGRIYIDPTELSISGEETVIEGGDVIIASGDNGTIELSELKEGAITATGDLTVSVGENGVMMTDSTDNILKAEGQVNLFADEIRLPEDVDVSDITGDNVVIGSGQIVRDVSIMASGNSSGEAGITLPFEVILSNNGPNLETYLLTVTDEEGWSLSQLPSSLAIDGQGTTELTLNVVLPSTRKATNVITVTAISLADPTVMTTTEINVMVTELKSDTVEVDVVTQTPCPSTGVINRQCRNQEQLFTDVTIDTKANVAGGTFAGTIENRGIISQATVQKGAVITGGKYTGYITNDGTLTDFEFVGAEIQGGELAGKVRNNSQVGGVFINVSLAANTEITGGYVEGEIGGKADAPAVLKNVRVKAKTRLSHVTLDEEVQLEDEITFADSVRLGPNLRIRGGSVHGAVIGDVEAPATLEELTVESGSTLENVVIGENVLLPTDIQLGRGVRFGSRADIPYEVELIEILPDLSTESMDGITFPDPVDLTADILASPTEGILATINQLPDIQTNGWELRQTESGYFELIVENSRYAVLPVSLKKARTRAGLEVQASQSVRFTTETGLEVLAQPALQAPTALQSALAVLDLKEFTVQTNGNLQIPSAAGQWFSARPDIASVEVDSEAEMGLQFEQSLYGSQFVLASLIFESEGQRREQRFYPSVAQPEALFSSATGVTLGTDGLVSFTQNGEAYRGIVDYLVTQTAQLTSERLEVEVETASDLNGDGIEDFVLNYSTGEQQILFALGTSQ